MLSFPLWGSDVFKAAPTAASCASGACDSFLKEESQYKNKNENSIDSTAKACDTGACPTSKK